jgi:hypothetical protein
VTVLPSAQRRALLIAPYAIVAIGLSVVVYAPILQNYFWQDDFRMLQLLLNWPLGRFLTGRFNDHLLIVRNAFYAGMYAVAGADPLPYYCVLLVLHGINVGLVFATVYTVTRSAALACLAAAAWGTCPLNEGALGWIAASGNVVVATTTLAVLYDAVRAAWRRAAVGLARSMLWAGLLLAGAESFGTGLGLAIAGPLAMAWLVWDRLTLAARGLLLAVPVFTIWLYGWNQQPTLAEQLSPSGLAMAEMLFDLQAFGVTTLVRGFAHTPSIFERIPWSLASLTVFFVTALAMCVWAIAAARCSSGRTRRLLITLAVLALCDYGSIALGRAPMIERANQSLLGWAAQTRYHYSGTTFLAIGLAVALSTLFGKRLAVWAHATLLVWLTVFAISYTRTPWTIQHYDDERQRVAHVLARIDAVIRVTPAWEPVVTYNVPFSEGPYIAGEASIYVMNRYRFDREVYFVDPGAVGIYGMFPGSPLAHAVLPPPATRLACPRFTLQSDAR